MILKNESLEIKGVKLFTIKNFKDNRGSFYEVFLSNKGIKEFDINYIQENESVSKYGVFRGMHFQKGIYSQSKLIRVIKGKALDIICDLRKSSKTFKKIISVKITPKNILFLPKGLAHGFIALEDKTILNYKCDNYYEPKSESGFNLLKSNLNFDFNLFKENLILSDKDKNLPIFKDSYFFD